MKTPMILALSGLLTLILASHFVAAQPDPRYYYSKMLDVPPALEYGGNYPTAMAMVLLAHNDYLELFPAHITDFGTQEALDLIASPEYFADYYHPEDRGARQPITDRSGEPALQSNHHLLRPGNSVADWTQTSQSYLLMRSGQSWVSEAKPYFMRASGRVESSQETTIAALSREVNARKALDTLPVSIRMIKPDPGVIESDFWWHTITTHIEDGQPLIALRDHYRYAHLYEAGQARVIIGYAVGSGRRKVLVHDTEQGEILWESFPTHQEPPPPPEPTGDPFQDAWNDAEYRADLTQGSWWDSYGSDFQLDDLITIDVGEYTPTLRHDALHRFFNRQAGVYFHTASVAEAQSMLGSETSPWKYHGPVFRAEYAADGLNRPVFRLYDRQSGTHFYTIDAAEKDALLTDAPARYSLDGIAFYAHHEPPPGDLEYKPVWRCFIPASQSYYFTASQLEVYYIRYHVNPDLIEVEGVVWYSRSTWDVK